MHKRNTRACPRRSRRNRRASLGRLTALAAGTPITPGPRSATWPAPTGQVTPTAGQTGTEADCDGGTASYQGWYEIFPNPLILSDRRQGWTQSTRQAEPGAQLGSAEIIAEAPSSGPVPPLAP